MGYITLLYEPIYEIFGVPAALTPNGQDAAGVTVTVIERTGATDAPEDSSSARSDLSIEPDRRVPAA